MFALVVKKLTTDACFPIRATENSAGLDISACKEYILKPMEQKTIDTGIAILLPCGYEAQIRSRSGLASKHSVIVFNSPGTIDSDYRGEIKVLLMNFGKTDFKVEKGMRIAQMVISNYVKVNQIKLVDELDKTQRGSGGFGSTGLM